MKRLLIVLAAAALVVVGMGAIPIGGAAVQAVVPFARNADRIDGIHASKAPVAGDLVALGKDKLLPASVIPRAYATVTTPADKPGYSVLTKKHFARIVHQGTGVYLLFPARGIDARGLSPVVGTYLPKAATATPGFAFAAGTAEQVFRYPPDEVVVETAFVVKTFTLADGGEMVPADVSFTILVP